MGQQFCTACGAKLSEGNGFCEHCGAKAGQINPQEVQIQAERPATAPRSFLPGHEKPGKKPVGLIVLGILIVLILAGAVLVIGFPQVTTGTIPLLPGQTTPVPTTSPSPVQTPVVPSVTTTIPTPTPEPFPDALALGKKYPFGSGKVASEGTVYRYWINDTYQWHNDMDNKYYTQKPHAGNKYLFIFVQMTNIGDTRVWLPPSSSVVVHYNGNLYTQDPTHYKPDKVGDAKATPVEIGEIQYFHTLNGDQYTEDFGFSHGTELGYIYPGASNAVDGYIIFEVPQSLTAETSYAEISFNGQARATWRLA